MQEKKFTHQQSQLVSELTERYKISAEDITFFPGDPKPFIGYEATCVMCNDLVPGLTEISIDHTLSFTDAITLKCTLKFSDGRIRSAVGVANHAEPGEGGEELSQQQLHQLASSRAIRNVLRTAGIDLLKLHSNPTAPTQFTGPTNRENLIRQAHALGEENGYINGPDKGLWRRLLFNRYKVDTSAVLSDSQLADLCSLLQAVRPQAEVAAAA
jgi:hypothetical protein